MKLHRAIILVAMMLLAVGALALLLVAGIARFDTHSLIALVVVVLAAAAGGVGFSAFAETEVRALMNFDDLKIARKLGAKIEGGGGGEIQGERDNGGSIHALGGDQRELVVKLRDQFRSEVRAQYAGGMRVEGDGEGASAEFAGATHDLLQYMLMSAMNTVEVADAGDCWDR